VGKGGEREGPEKEKKKDVEKELRTRNFAKNQRDRKGMPKKNVEKKTIKELIQGRQGKAATPKLPTRKKGAPKGRRTRKTRSEKETGKVTGVLNLRKTLKKRPAKTSKGDSTAPYERKPTRRL